MVLVVVLHHAFDVEQFASQPATLSLLELVVWCLQNRASRRVIQEEEEQGVALFYASVLP